MQKTRLFTSSQIVARILAVIITVEFIIMLLLGDIHDLTNQWVAAIIDVLILALVATPAIYFWVVKPFVRARESAYEEISQQALTDPLTQLANRRHFDHVIDLEFGRHARNDTELALILLDIDHFKEFNDSYGHLQGDQCLLQIADVIATIASRPADLASRYGGEEFICVLPETGLEGALVIADKIKNGIEAIGIKHETSKVSNHVTVSLGIATSKSAGIYSAADLINLADVFLYKAKESGRNRLEFDKELREQEIDTHFVKLVWKDEYRSGNELIDMQHEQLFQMSDNVLDSVMKGKPAEDIFEMMTQLIEAVTRHFDDEIKILNDLGIEDVKEHALEHSDLSKKSDELLAKFKDGNVSAGEIFQYVAFEVIMKHILNSDAKSYPLISNQSEK